MPRRLASTAAVLALASVGVAAGGAALPACQLVLDVEAKELVVGADDGSPGPGSSGGTSGGGTSPGGVEAGPDGAPAPVCTGKEDLQNDPHNCGACAHDCLGGTCAGGACTKVTLATGQNAPLQIAVDATSVYWSNWADSGDIVKIDKLKGGAVTPLKTGLPRPTRLALDDQRVFWVNGGVGGGMGSLDSIAKDGTRYNSYFADEFPVGVAFAGTEIYWTHAGTAGTSFADGHVEYCTIPAVGAGCTRQTVTSPVQYPLAIAATPFVVYFTAKGTPPGYQDGAVLRCGIPCTTTTPLAANLMDPDDVVLDDKYLYYLEAGLPEDYQSGRINRCDLPGCTNKTVLADGQARPSSLATDGKDVVWTNEGDPDDSTGTVELCARVGCDKKSTRLDQGLATPSGVATDGTAVYWTNTFAGQVLKIAKPD